MHADHLYLPPARMLLLDRHGRKSSDDQIGQCLAPERACANQTTEIRRRDKARKSLKLSLHYLLPHRDDVGEHIHERALSSVIKLNKDCRFGIKRIPVERRHIEGAAAHGGLICRSNPTTPT
jgi:hypothetical protein